MNRNSADARQVAGRRGAAAIALLVGALALAGCASGQTASTTTPSAIPPPTSAAAPVRPECTAVQEAARNVNTQVEALVRGQGERAQVIAAVTQLQTALGAARTALGPAAQADVDAARTAAQQLQAALAAQPFDLAAARAATAQAFDAVGKVLTICTPASSAPVTPAPAPAS